MRDTVFMTTYTYLLHDRYPCPPHLSLPTNTASSSSQLARSLMAQHMVTTYKQMLADKEKEKVSNLLVFRPILHLESPSVLNIVQPNIRGPRMSWAITNTCLACVAPLVIQYF